MTPTSSELETPVGAGAQPADDEVVEGTRFTPGLLKVCIFAAFALVPILEPGLPLNLAFCDLFIVVIIFLAIVYMTRVGSPATLAAVKSLPWIWLILLGSYLGLSAVGIPLWSTLDLLRGMLAFATFFCFWHILYTVHLERYALWGTATGFVVTTVALLILPFKYRGLAFFEHPNYCAHYCVLAGTVLIWSARRWWVKGIWVASLGICLWKTGSFGAVAMMLGILGLVALRSVARNTGVLLAGLVAIAIGGLLLISPAVDTTTVNPDETVAVASDTTAIEVSSAFTSDRFDKSQGSRFAIWSQAVAAYSQEPLGVGPDGVRQRGIGLSDERGGTLVLEIHADALGYLVERGIIGLVGFIGLWVVIARQSKPRGLARLLIVAVLVAGIFRETMHYRHVWLLLALAFVLDARRQPALDDRAAAEQQPAIAP